MLSSLFGVADHVRNAATGRPEPHSSWQERVIATWITWGAALGFSAMAISSLRRGAEWSVVAQAFAAAILFGGVAAFYEWDLRRKRDALRRATESYEQMLDRAYH